MSEPEPTYVFIRGQGWIPETHRRLLAQDTTGTNYWLVDRRPEKGEHYIMVNKWAAYDRWGTRENRDIVDLEKVAQRKLRWTYFTGLSKRVGRNFSDGKFYVTVVPA